MKVSTIGGFSRVKESGKRGRKAVEFDHSLYLIGEGEAVDLTDDICALLGVEVEGITPEGITGKKVNALVAKTRARIAQVCDHERTASGGWSIAGTSDLVSWTTEVEDENGPVMVEDEDGTEYAQTQTRYGITVV